jgi:hypothetical protein
MISNLRRAAAMISLRRAAALSAMALLALFPLAVPASGVSHHPQHRQIAVTRLSDFKVVMTATRVGTSLDATVTASGYRHTAHGWHLISTKRIGKAASWSWFATQVCSLKVTQFKPEPSSASPAAEIRVRMFFGPAIGCVPAISKHWKP